jgi:hypothetical protein
MKKITKLRWHLIAVVALVAVALVRTTIGQHQVPLGILNVITSRQVGPPPGHFPFPANPDPSSERSMGFGRKQMQVENGVVTIDVSARVYDTVPGILYVWSTRVFEAAPELKILSERHHTDKPTWLVETPGRMEPTFHDELFLPAGSYYVEVILSAVPPDFDWGTVAFDKNLKQKVLSSVSESGKVTVDRPWFKRAGPENPARFDNDIAVKA